MGRLVRYLSLVCSFRHFFGFGGHFWLIMRSHERDVGSMSDYLTGQCEAFAEFQLQSDDPRPIGFGAADGNGITVFMNSGTTTIESTKVELEGERLSAQIRQSAG
jgi:hypothetical protein